MSKPESDYYSDSDNWVFEEDDAMTKFHTSAVARSIDPSPGRIAWEATTRLGRCWSELSDDQKALYEKAGQAVKAHIEAPLLSTIEQQTKRIEELEHWQDAAMMMDLEHGDNRLQFWPRR